MDSRREFESDTARIKEEKHRRDAELQSGDTRFYTTDTTISFNGGASEEGGLTALRRAVVNSCSTELSR